MAGSFSEPPDSPTREPRSPGGVAGVTPVDPGAFRLFSNNQAALSSFLSAFQAVPPYLILELLSDQKAIVSCQISGHYLKFRRLCFIDTSKTLETF